MRGGGLTERSDHGRGSSVRAEEMDSADVEKEMDQL